MLSAERGDDRLIVPRTPQTPREAHPRDELTRPSCGGEDALKITERSFRAGELTSVGWASEDADRGAPPPPL